MAYLWNTRIVYIYHWIFNRTGYRQAMSKNTTDLREQIEVMLDKFDEWANWCYAAESMIEKPEEYPQMKLLEDLLTLISNREKLAREDELENLQGADMKLYTNKVITDRLATLRKELDGGQR